MRQPLAAYIKTLTMLQKRFEKRECAFRRSEYDKLLEGIVSVSQAVTKDDISRYCGVAYDKTASLYALEYSENRLQHIRFVIDAALHVAHKKFADIPLPDRDMLYTPHWTERLGRWIRAHVERSWWHEV